MDIKASYGVVELARLAGTTRKVMLLDLKTGQVPIHKRGRHHVVHLSDLRRLVPSLWDSIVERNHVLELTSTSR